MPTGLDIPFNQLVAALVGLAIGLEREWSGHTTGPDARFAGMRTFTILGALGGITGWFVQTGVTWIAALLLGALFLLVVVAYATSVVRTGTTPDGTTEVAALAVVSIGLVAGLGFRAAASGAAALLVLLLSEKRQLHLLTQRVGQHDLRAAGMFAVMALVILPLLPNESYGPYDAFNPRRLWIVVLLFSGLNFAGYIARRIVGETRGLGVTGFIGGFISSTAVSLNFSRRSRDEPELALPLALGVVAACTVLLPRIYVVVAALQPSLSLPLLRYLLPPFLVGISVVAAELWIERESRNGTSDQPIPATEKGAAGMVLRNPLEFWSSIQMAFAFQVVLFLIAALQEEIGSAGVLASAAVLGLTDMDALTVSMTRVASDPAQMGVAALAIGIGVLSNTLLKTSLVVAIGAPRFKVRAGSGLLLLAVGSAVGIWLGIR